MVCLFFLPTILLVKLGRTSPRVGRGTVATRKVESHKTKDREEVKFGCGVWRGEKATLEACR